MRYSCLSYVPASLYENSLYPAMEGSNRGFKRTGWVLGVVLHLFLSFSWGPYKKVPWNDYFLASFVLHSSSPLTLSFLSNLVGLAVQISLFLLVRVQISGWFWVRVKAVVCRQLLRSFVFGQLTLVMVRSLCWLWNRQQCKAHYLECILKSQRKHILMRVYRKTLR